MAKKKSIYDGLYTLRSDGRYMGYYRDQDGKRHPVYGKTEEEVYHKIQRKLDEQSTPKVVTFRDIAESWYGENWHNINLGTQASYHAHYIRAINYMDDTPLEEITAFDIQRHLDQLGTQHYSVSTIKKQRVIYKLIFRHAITNGLCDLKYNPAEQPTIPRTAVKATHRNSPEESVFVAIQEQAQTAYWGLFALFLLCTGMRKGEALAVQWRDIDFQEKTISCTKAVHYRGSVPQITTPKTASGVRTVPLLAPLAAALKKPSGAKPDDYVFPGEDPSKPLPQSGYKRRWTHYCKDIGIDITAHQLRHGYATMLFEAGVDLYTAQKLLGHADLETTTQIYTHLRDKQKNASIDKLFQHTKNGLK